MPSRVDPDHLLTGVPVSKEAARASWRAAKAELEHGGLFTQSGSGALERRTQDKLSESISAADFGALGDASSATVTEWLVGGQYSRGAADLTELRAMTGIADLELADTIDWAAITMALKAAGERPVLMTGTKYHVVSRPIVIQKGGLMGLPSTMSGAIVPVSHTFNLIHLKPGPSTRIVLKDLYLAGGLNVVYGDGSLGGYVDDNSVIENLQISGYGHGFFFDNLHAIGVRFTNIRVEGCVGHGIYFRGDHMLNAAQLINCRAATCSQDGMRFENTSDQADTPSVVVSGCTVEYNNGNGMNLIGYRGTIISPHFEGNDNDQSGDFDLRLGSSGTPEGSQVRSGIVVESAYFSACRNPDLIAVSGSEPGTQSLVMVFPQLGPATKIDATRLNLTLIGAGADLIPANRVLNNPNVVRVGG